jgi:beta-xylosidase
MHFQYPLELAEISSHASGFSKYLFIWLSLETGSTGFPINPWNGTGGLAPEGPHIYKKDGYYYLTIA